MHVQNQRHNRTISTCSSEVVIATLNRYFPTAWLLRDVFGTLSNIYDEVYLQKQLTAFTHYFLEIAPS